MPHCHDPAFEFHVYAAQPWTLAGERMSLISGLSKPPTLFTYPHLKAIVQ